MSDLTKILAENQNEMLKLIAPLNKKHPVSLNIYDSDSESENMSVARTSTPVTAHTATSSETTPNNSRNKYFNECKKNVKVWKSFDSFDQCVVLFVKEYCQISFKRHTPWLNTSFGAQCFLTYEVLTKTAQK